MEQNKLLFYYCCYIYLFVYRIILKCISFFNRLLIGAPRGNYTQSDTRLKFLNEPGIVYRCNLPGPCVEIKPISTEDEKLYIHQIDTYAYVKKEHSWFGGAMSIEKNSGFLTVYTKDMRN